MQTVRKVLNLVSVPALAIVTDILPQATVGAPYSVSLQATGGSQPYTWSLFSGTLPAGLTLDSTGTISGTPTEAGNVNALIQVTDSSV